MSWCFFDPGHGPIVGSVQWAPPYGVTRPIAVCAPCADRVNAEHQGHHPDVYPQHAGHQPQPQQGYYEQGYDQQHRGGSGVGKMVAAGAAGAAAGLVGGMVINEILDDDEEDHQEEIAEAVEDYFEEE